MAVNQIAQTTRNIRGVRSPSRAVPTREPTLIASVQRALRLLEAVGGHLQGATAKQLARAAGLPLGTTYHLLRTLTHEGYLRRAEGRFFYGASVDGIGRADHRQSERADLRSRMVRLGEELEAAVYFAVYQDGEIRVVDVAAGSNRPAVDEWADFRSTAHAHAVGQCLLSQLGEEARRDHLDRHPPVELTPTTVTDRAVLLRRLAAAEPTRPVLERQQYALGTVCAAVPITVGSAVATMALSLPIDRADQLPAKAERLRSLVGAMSPSFVH
ncbi:helix-turn-helix domain-containing protein [Kitasatospora sp. NBC_00070]|uniref:IclR family transcriptional regulator n=1 Tax=Kitasatospora sp. NBC_00070 TaxID=2975962 RepID=UPI00324ED4C3